MLNNFFNPGSVAIIGASRDEKSVGCAVLKNVLKSKIKVFPINPNAKAILGVKCYSKIAEIRSIVDLAVIVVPARIVPSVLNECGLKEVKNIVIISAGFSEVGNTKLENEVSEIGKRFGMNILGPNCLGFITPKINVSFFEGSFNEGKVGLISQSGALAVAMLDWFIERNIGISYFISLGNAVDISLTDLVKFLDKDETTKSIGLYIESLKNGRDFVEACSEIKKTVIAIKAGSSVKGAESAQSHTGAISSDDRIVEGVFKQFGIIRVKTIKDLLNSCLASAWQNCPENNKLVIVTNAGGLGVMSADSCEKYGLELVSINRSVFDSFLPETWSKTNPIDIVGDADSLRYEQTFKVLLKNKNSFGGVIVILTPQMMSEPERTAKIISAFSKELNKPCFVCFTGGEKLKTAKKNLYENKIPIFDEPDDALRIFSLLL